MQSCLKNTHMGWLNSLNVRLGSSVNRLKKNVDAGATVKAESSKSGILFAPDILKLKFPSPTLDAGNLACLLRVARSLVPAAFGLSGCKILSVLPAAH